MDDVQLFRLFVSNKFKGGGKKHKGPRYNESTFMKDYDAAWKGTRYDNPEWRTFWTELAKRESSFNPAAINSIGAKGYFLLMPYNRSANWKNNTLQFVEADRLIRRMESLLTLDDLKRAEALGLSKQALLAGAWLGGVGGVRAALRGKNRADMNGSTVMGRMKAFNNLSSILPQANPVETYLNTPIGTPTINNPVNSPILTGEELDIDIPALVNSVISTYENNETSDANEINTHVLPEDVIQEEAPQNNNNNVNLVLNYNISNQPKFADILVEPNTPTIINKLEVLANDDINRRAAAIKEELIRQKVEDNMPNSQFNHFFVNNNNTLDKQLQDLRFLSSINNTAAYGGNINSNNILEGGGPFSWVLPAMPGLYLVLKLINKYKSKPKSVLTPKPPKLTYRNALIDRRRPNTSPTAKRSLSIENQIYGLLPKERSSYDIPYIPNKSILINGSTTSTNALDSLAKYAGIHNRTLQPSEKPIQRNPKPRKITREEAIGLSLRETKGGALPYTNDSRVSKDKEAKRAFYNANVFTAFKDVPATALVNDYHYNQTSKSVPPLLDAFQYYSLGDYNRGDPNHTSDVILAGKEAFKNPKVIDWWNNEGKYWFNGTYKNANDDAKKKALGGNLFYDGGDLNDDIKTLIASLWPATTKVDYVLKPQEGFVQFIDDLGNPRGTIETITPNQVASRWSPIYANMGIPANERPLLEEANRVDYRDYDEEGNPIGDILIGKNYITTDLPGLNTIVYNPQYTNVEDIKQDLLHVMHDDPEYQKLYDVYMTAALNDLDFLYHDVSEGNLEEIRAMLNGDFSIPTKKNLERSLNAEGMLQALLDGYLRDQFYSGTPEERFAAGYTKAPYTINNPSLLEAINNIKGYLELKALGGPLFNARTPIESFLGGKPLPIVRK